MRKKDMQKTYNKVRLLYLATPRARQQIVRAGDRELLDSICECCVNVLNGAIPLTDEQKSHLSKHKHRLRRLAWKKLSLAKKKRIVQTGRGFLGALLVPAVTLLSSLFSGSKR
jgi:hypothetical protein